MQSIALSVQSIALSSQSIALSRQSTALAHSRSQSIALSSQSIALGSQSIALRSLSIVLGSQSIALGSQSIVLRQRKLTVSAILEVMSRVTSATWLTLQPLVSQKTTAVEFFCGCSELPPSCYPVSWYLMQSAFASGDETLREYLGQ